MGKLVNRTRMSVGSAPGTSAITLGSAVSGYQSFSAAGVNDGDTISYVAEDGSAWELGQGLYAASGTTLTRTLIASSTGSLLNLSAGAQVYITPLASDLQSGNTSDPNVLDNSAFDWWQRSTTPTTALSCSTGTRTFLADRVWVNPAGAAVTQAQSTSVPVGSKSLYSLLVTGAASVTTVNIGLQRVLARDVPRIRRVSTFQVAFYNGTGAAITPNLILSTPSSTDSYGTTTAQLTQGLQSCPAGAWTVIFYTGDLSGLSNIANGLQVEVQVPSGALVANKTINLAEMDLRPGTGVMPFERRPAMTDLWRCRQFAQIKDLGGFGQSSGTSIVQFEFEPQMFTTPSFANLAVGTSSNGAVSSESAADQYGGFFQVSIGAANGYTINRRNIYLAEP